jgi:phosphate butyryltransferase
MKKILVVVNPTEDYEKVFAKAIENGYINEIIKTTNETFDSDVDSLFTEGNSPIFMKGLIETADFMRLILKRKDLYEPGNLLSHCGFFDDRFILTDAAMNLNPDAESKLKILQNAIFLYKKLNPEKNEKPKISALTPAGKYNPKIQSSVDAIYLTEKLVDQADVVMDQLDTAISSKASEIKGKGSGKPTDIILCHDLDSGNILYKAFTLLGNYTVAGLIIGAKYPICVTSRADSFESKLKSIQCAAKILN